MLSKVALLATLFASTSAWPYKNWYKYTTTTTEPACESDTVQVNVKEASPFWVIVELKNLDCTCLDECDIQSVAIRPQNYPEDKWVYSCDFWHDTYGPAYGFGTHWKHGKFYGCFDLKIETKDGKTVIREDLFKLYDCDCFDFEHDFCITENPTPAPTSETLAPTDNPTLAPTAGTAQPTTSPTGNTPSPTDNPTPSPTNDPTQYPTANPTVSTLAPTKNPTEKCYVQIRLKQTSKWWNIIEIYNSDCACLNTHDIEWVKIFPECYPEHKGVMAVQSWKTKYGMAYGFGPDYKFGPFGGKVGIKIQLNDGCYRFDEEVYDINEYCYQQIVHMDANFCDCEDC